MVVDLCSSFVMPLRFTILGGFADVLECGTGLLLGSNASDCDGMHSIDFRLPLSLLIFRSLLPDLTFGCFLEETLSPLVQLVSVGGDEVEEVHLNYCVPVCLPLRYFCVAPKPHENSCVALNMYMYTIL